MTPPLHVYRVGELYAPTRTRWPEAVDYNYRGGGGHELRLFWPRLSASNVQAVRTGSIELALYVEPPVIVLLYKIAGACDWSDQPFTIHLVPAAERQLPIAGSRALLTILLIDADTGILRVIRTITLAPALTTALHTAIAEQAAAPFDQDAYDHALAAIYRRHPTTRDLLRRATVRTG